ncbi:ER protein Pkr1-domain-containing protein [Lineolata rhizophorae]|uniref:ER protein Pkr1-domain-containing protein n=1 Tax=Lineolata rhizophorae TaxID=578093 RepID=A0A6A6P5I1_9PEZI|nr:ER protein Pkr1-domain-containing protein [Lineolata rhizophorae]
MADFIANLWNSIFTPGPTPTLLLATNAAFAALQVLLLALLAATRSIHFLILSGLSASLWWAINWFAGELAAAQAKEEEAKRIRGARRSAGGPAKERDRAKEKGDDAAEKLTPAEGPGEEEGVMDTGDETETEMEAEKSFGDISAMDSASDDPSSGGQQAASGASAAPASPQASATGADTGLKAQEPVTRRRSLLEVGEMSTDSEWEQVEKER